MKETEYELPCQRNLSGHITQQREPSSFHINPLAGTISSGFSVLTHTTIRVKSRSSFYGDYRKPQIKKKPALRGEGLTSTKEMSTSVAAPPVGTNESQ
jgi:hypothetical protein